MTINTFSNKIAFKNHKDAGTETAEEAPDFASKMVNAIDVQLIDTNLYMSKELWLPFGSRGAFGGQVCISISNQKSIFNNPYFLCILDRCSSVTCSLGYLSRRFFCSCKITKLDLETLPYL